MIRVPRLDQKDPFSGKMNSKPTQICDEIDFHGSQFTVAVTDGLSRLNNTTAGKLSAIDVICRIN
jgi:hypothetical protein